jgi:hypothetical protein
LAPPTAPSRVAAASGRGSDVGARTDGNDQQEPFAAKPDTVGGGLYGPRMGMNSNARRDAKAKARPQTQQDRTRRLRVAHGSAGNLRWLFDGVDVPAGREAELTTLVMLGQAWDALPSTAGACPGLLLIHPDGNFECHGGCDGGINVSAMTSRHDIDDAVWPGTSPQRPRVETIFCPCRFCTP